MAQASKIQDRKSAPVPKAQQVPKNFASVISLPVTGLPQSQSSKQAAPGMPRSASTFESVASVPMRQEAQSAPAKGALCLHTRLMHIGAWFIICRHTSCLISAARNPMLSAQSYVHKAAYMLPCWGAQQS